MTNQPDCFRGPQSGREPSRSSTTINKRGSYRLNKRNVLKKKNPFILQKRDVFDRLGLLCVTYLRVADK